MDIHCRRCGEPWDIFGVPKSAGGYADDDDGDMTVEEAKKMLKGLGCPCCVSETHEKDEHLLDALPDVLNHEDPEGLLDQMGI